jgi:hypothetical protein
MYEPYNIYLNLPNLRQALPRKVRQNEAMKFGIDVDNTGIADNMDSCANLSVIWLGGFVLLLIL